MGKNIRRALLGLFVIMFLMPLMIILVCRLTESDSGGGSGGSGGRGVNGVPSQYKELVIAAGSRCNQIDSVADRGSD